jgi:hypothetical protein
MNITEEWFWNQWYDDRELRQLQEWIDTAGPNVIIRRKEDGKWSGFHVLDTELKIDIAGQPTKEDCTNWMKRLNLTVVFVER